MSPVYYRLFKSGRLCPSQLLLLLTIKKQSWLKTNKQTKKKASKSKQKTEEEKKKGLSFAHLCLSLLRAVARLLTALWALFFADRPPPAGEVAAVPRLRFVEPAEGPRFREPPCCEAPNFERRVLPPAAFRLVARRLLSFRPGERPPRERFDRLEALLERFRGLTRPVERRLTPPWGKGNRGEGSLFPPFLPFFRFRRANACRARQSSTQRQQMRRMSTRAMIRPRTRAFSGGSGEKMLKKLNQTQTI